jgi:predicted nucleic acid-binding protein
MRVFLDANILFSAALANGRMRAFLAVLHRHGNCLTNLYAIEEARRNLQKKSPAALPDLDEIIHQCEIVSELVDEIGIDLKSKDIPILSGAIAGQASHLLTGDCRDLGNFFGTAVHGVKIVSPRDLAEELIQKYPSD